MGRLTVYFRCLNESYSEELPAASIIICYYNEASSALIRMVNSILDRTPSDLVNEILLVNDYSDLGLLRSYELEKRIDRNLLYFKK